MTTQTTNILRESIVEQICASTGLSTEQVNIHIESGEIMMRKVEQPTGAPDHLRIIFILNDEALNTEENEYRRQQVGLYTLKIGNDYGPEIYNLGYNIAGRWEEHEQYPYDKYLLEKYTTEELEQLKISGACFDFGCGNGRMLYHMEKYFDKIHGGDLMPEFVVAAERYLAHMNINEDRFKIFNTAGANSKLSNSPGKPEISYDFIFSTVVLIHILPHFVKMNILKDHYNLLKSGGRICHQMTYCETVEDYKFSKGQHYRWDYNSSARPDEMTPTTGQYNTIIFEQDLDIIKKDLEGIGFKNIDFTFKETPHENSEGYKDTKWIYIHAQK